MRLEYDPYGPRLVTDVGRLLLPAVSPGSGAITASWGEPRQAVAALTALELRALAREMDRL